MIECNGIGSFTPSLMYPSFAQYLDGVAAAAASTRSIFQFLVLYRKNRLESLEMTLTDIPLDKNKF